MSSEKKTIVVIGLGAIGKNHFRALLRLSNSTDLYLVDPMFDEDSINALCCEHQASNQKNHTLHFLISAEELPKEVDLAVVATRSDVRFKVLKQLLEASRVKYLILEKVLFQELEHYDQAEILLKEAKADCWVHHTRRAFPFYVTLKDLMATDQNIRVEIRGGLWGLACNGLHFLDLFQFLIASRPLSLDISGLQSKIISSKREGFREVVGTVTATSTDDHSFSMTSFDFELPLEVNIHSRQRSILIDELNGWVRYRDKKNIWSPEVKEEEVVHYISGFTNRLAESIFSTGTCHLPCYRESSLLHQLYLSGLLEHFSRVDDKAYTVCPIT